MTEPTGYTALDLIGFTDQGDYDSSTAYVQNDLVHYNNSVWRCLIDDTTGQTPEEGSYWTIFVESTVDASGISYDGTDSGLSATTVQDAIDEVVEEKADSTIISDAYDSSTTYAAGDYFIYDNTLYYVDVACTGITPPNTSYYTATTVSSEISNLITPITLYEGTLAPSAVSTAVYTSISDLSSYRKVSVYYHTGDGNCRTDYDIYNGSQIGSYSRIIGIFEGSTYYMYGYIFFEDDQNRIGIECNSLGSGWSDVASYCYIYKIVGYK